MSSVRMMTRKKSGDEKITEADFDTICRICLKKSTPLESVYAKEIQTKLSDDLNLEVKEDDGLPGNICSKCSSKLLYFDEFCTMARTSDFFLKGLKNKNKAETKANCSRKRERKLKKDLQPEEKKVKIEEKDSRKKIKRESVEEGNKSETEQDRGGEVTESEEELFMLIVESGHKVEEEEEELILGEDEEQETEVLPTEQIIIGEEYTLEEVEDEVIGLDDIYDEEENDEQFDEKSTMEEHSYTRINDEDGEDMNELVDEENTTAVESLVTLSDVPTEAGVIDISTSKTEESKFDFVHNYALADDPENKIFRVMLESNICEECDTEFLSLKALSKHYFQVHDTVLVLADSLLLTCPICKGNWKISDKQKFIEHLCTYKHLGYHFVKVNKFGKAIKPLKRESAAFTPLSSIQEMLTNGTGEIKHQSFEYSEADSSDTEMPFVERSNFDYLTEELENKKKPTGAKKGSALLSHLKTTFFCDICGKGCGGKANLNRHIATHSKDTNKSKIQPRFLECAICGKIFNSKLSLKEHLIQHNNETLITAKPNTTNFICIFCGGKFNSKQKLLAHKAVHRTERSTPAKKCYICFKMFYSESSYSEHMALHSSDGLVCQTCRKICNSVKELTDHVQTHLTITYDCEICHLSFITEVALNDHKIKAGHDVITINCLPCDVDFTNITTYIEHLKTHTDNEPFNCLLCSKKLANASFLVAHLEEHLENCEISCTDCPLKFSDNAKLEKHRLMKHQSRTTKVFICDEDNCSRLFNSAEELEKHKKFCANMERNYLCELCMRYFPQETHLDVHMRIHTGERPYTCPHCSKSFYTRSICTNHIASEHDGVGVDSIICTLNKDIQILHIEES